MRKMYGVIYIPAYFVAKHPEARSLAAYTKEEEEVPWFNEVVCRGTL